MEEEDEKGKVVKIASWRARGKEKEDDDCYEIEAINFARKLSVSSSGGGGDDDVAIVAKKGEVEVALRDFSHPRHLCGNYPFGGTPHEKYCKKCFCYKCEIAAPCSLWWGTDGHCHVLWKKPKRDPFFDSPLM
ncbi:hypothetical protein AXF42_Ash019028 [Apostasia shenzhenica]|uniref:Uncharacterized protein n=1 Tax=Apostasia shenzhenica TaxID=1088818 RepID=A0A2I0AC57_9ASPA|nr:hypothetical protein AXF42_Ash019028 [Apostasia shenzhenica]